MLLFQKSRLFRLTINTVWFFSKHFICHFYFLWFKIISVIFTPYKIRCSKFFSKFYWLYFWNVFYVLYYIVGSIFLTIHFKHLESIEWFNLLIAVLIILFRLLVLYFFLFDSFSNFFNCLSLNLLINVSILPIS